MMQSLLCAKLRSAIATVCHARLKDLCTSMVVPAYEVDDGGPFLFWYDKTKSETGYKTLDRKPMFYSATQNPVGVSQAKQAQQNFLSDKSKAFDQHDANARTKLLKNLQDLDSQQSTARDRYGVLPQGRRIFYDFAGDTDLSHPRNGNPSWFQEPYMQSHAGTDFQLRTVARASSAAPTFFPGATLAD